MALDHPICETSNYADSEWSFYSETSIVESCCANGITDYQHQQERMLTQHESFFAVTTSVAAVFSCYQYVTETHCYSTSPVPYGVCNRSGPDTSQAAKQTSSATAHTSPSSSWRWTLALIGVVACSAIQLSVSAFLHFFVLLFSINWLCCSP